MLVCLYGVLNKATHMFRENTVLVKLLPVSAF